MSFRRFGPSAEKFRQRCRSRRQRLRKRQPQLESLERRQLLTVGPQLMGITPDGGRPMTDGQVLSISPQQLTLDFEDLTGINPSTVNAIQVVRSVNDVFGDSDDSTVEPGFVGIGATPREVVVRFAEPLSEARYQVNITGTGDNPLANTAGEAFNDGQDFSQRFELALAPQVLAVVPQPLTRDGITGELSQSANQIVVHFNDDNLNPVQSESNSFYRLVNQDDDSLLLPSSADYNPVTDQVTLTFASDLPEGNYRLEIGEASESNDRLVDATHIGTLGASFTTSAFLGDTVAGADDIDLYRFDALDAGGLDVTATPTGVLDTTIRLFDDAGVELSASNSGAAGEADTLSFAIPGGTYYLGITSQTNAAYNPVDGTGAVDGELGIYQLDVAFDLALIADDDNSSFATATDLGRFGAAARSVQAAIAASPVTFPLPGGLNEPGQRDIPVERAYVGLGNTTPSGPLQVAFYNFQPFYPGPSGEPAVNLITPTQKARAREIFEIYGDHLGIQFVESPSLGLTVITGDPRAVDPSAPGGPGGLAGISDGSLNGMAIMDAAESWGDSEYGGMWFQVAMHEIGHNMGAGHTYHLPGLTIMGDRASVDPARFNQGEPVFPGDSDLTLFERYFPARSNDIDLYRFEVIESGRLEVQTIAQRMEPSASLLDTKITLFQEGAAARDFLASNDDYFGTDSYLDVELQPGVYFVAVTSTGLEDFDPAISDTGFGGTTEGVYEVDFDFHAFPNSRLNDNTGLALDGDADGVPGGLFEFWFQSGETIFVDKANDSTVGVDGDGSLADPFDSIPAALDAARNRIVVPGGGGIAIEDGQTFTLFDGVNPQLTFEFDSGGGVGSGNESVVFTAADTAEILATSIADAVNALATLNSTAVASGTVVELAGVTQLNLESVPSFLYVPNLVRVAGNGGADGNISTIADNLPFEVGLDDLDVPLVDGEQLLVPQGVTFMADAGTLFKLQRANLDAGSSSQGISRSHGAIQVLGIPGSPVYFRHFRDDSAGGDSDGPSQGPESGGWGGLVFREDAGIEDVGVFLNHVNYADISHGGGKVFVDGDEFSFTPIHLVAARPTISHNVITNSADAAISAGPRSFDDSLGRIGPDIHHNTIIDNSINGLFIRVNVEVGQPLDRLEGNARLDDFDITHVLTENLQIAGNPGGPILGPAGQLVARPAGRLRIDPGVVVKLEGARIEVEVGANLIAEGTADRRVIFTSQEDDGFGGSGTFDTTNDGDATPAMPGQWGGLFFAIRSKGSLDNVVVAHGGGLTPIEGAFDGFDPLEIHQADVRLSRSEFYANAAIGGNTNRSGRGTSDRATVFIRGAQPIVVDNIFRDNQGDGFSIDPSALQFQLKGDHGRSTGLAQRYVEFDNNRGPLFALNRLSNNETNGLTVRGGTLTTKSVWDDTNLVHVVEREIIVPDHNIYSGLILQSGSNASLVIKLEGAFAGFTATGNPLDIDDRIGGTIQVLGTGANPVVFTALEDDEFTAGLDLEGRPLGDTNNDGPSDGVAGDWRSIRLDRFSNDRNVRFLREVEPPFAGQQELNGTPAQARTLGALAPDLKSGNDNRSLGFKVNGVISYDSPSDVDVYSFSGKAGTEVWIDIDRTSFALDSMVELIDGSGRVIARSTDNDTLSGDAEHLIKFPHLIADVYTVNPLDAGMRVILPGAENSTNNYFVRVRSEPAPGDIENLQGGLTRGEYELQLRLTQVDEFPGSTIRFADIHYATDGIELLGTPTHSPLTGDTVELQSGNVTDVGNILTTDRGSLSIAGRLSTGDNVDLYTFSLDFDLVQAIGGVNSGGNTLATIFDIDYADGISRPDTTLALFDGTSGELLLISRDSNVSDDQLVVGPAGNVDDLGRGSFGPLDAFLGSVQLPTGLVSGASRSYLLAVMSNAQLPLALNASFDINGNSLVRLEPVTSIQRIAEDHIGFQGYTSGVAGQQTVQVAPETQLFDISSEIALSTNVVPLTLDDMVLYVSQFDRLHSVNPFRGRQTVNIGPLSVGGIPGQATHDIVMRSDGVMHSVEGLPMLNNGTAGAVAVVNPEDATQGNRVNDAIPDFQMGPPPMGVNSDRTDAITWRRAGFDSATNTVEYDLYYSVNDQDTGESVLYRADPDTFSGAIVMGEPWGPQGAIAGVGLTTGIAFAGQGFAQRMYGVSSDGLFYRILRFTGVPFHPETNAPFQGKPVPGAEAGFAGLSAGPKNLQDGAFADLLFAITVNGRIFALDTTGEPQPVFENDALFVDTGLSGVTGLALSTLDFNLWHPTLRRRSDDGHGINPAFDRSRANPTQIQVDINGNPSNEGEGGASFYFGFEPWQELDTQNEYLRYDGNYQFGAASEATHRDLSTNTNILSGTGGNNYNLPGGAQGSLVTNPVDLSAHTSTDKPTLYFNYFLETENANFVGTGPGCCMRDSARVFASDDDGATWTLLATNNSILSNQSTAELPTFLSVSSTASTNSQQRVQELYDNTGGWRQARIDLSEFAGSPTLQVRFDFSTAGSFDRGLEGDANGSYFEIERHLLNDSEGFYVDDLIIGFAERGEMVTNAPSDTQTFEVPQNPQPGGIAEILTGDYQLEIRRGTPTATTITGVTDDVIVTQPLDTNDRLIGEANRVGDRNSVREQGHIQVESNRIEDVEGFGILFDASVRAPALNLPSPPPVRNLPNLNIPRLVPAATIENNLIVSAASGGIQFRGDANTGDVSVAAVPFGRILNNTIFDSAIGIEVANNASPSILNNIIANASTGISVDDTSSSTVVGANLFSGNADDGRLGEDFIVQTIDEPLFIDPASGNFYLAPGSRAIDSSLNSLIDRPSIVAVGEPLGIPPSPILAPERDLFGQLRVDDPSQEPPPGLGSNIFKDRGAVERADFIGPSGRLISPLDQGAADLEPGLTIVRVDDPVISEILIQVSDVGLGVDTRTLTADRVTLEMDGVLLVEGVDYDFGFDQTNSTVRLSALPNNGTFREQYDVTLDNSVETGIRDLADTLIRPNRPGAITAFTIFTAGLNKPPTVFDDDAVTTEGVAVSIPVLANDEGPDSPVVADTLAIASPPANGTAVENADGTVLYTPNAGFSGIDTFTYTVEDLDGDTSNEATVSVTVVTDVNDSPVLDNSTPMSLSNINEDDSNSQGDTIGSIISSVPGDAITDVDIGAVEGLAIVAVDTSNGQWEYNLGAGWVAFGTLSDTAATLLGASDRVRFVPNPDFSGPSGSIAFRAWDQSTGQVGDIDVDVSINGGTTAFSSNVSVAGLNVIPINDPPRPQNDDNVNPGGLTTNEDTPFTIPDSLLLANDEDDTPGSQLEIVSINQDDTLGSVQLRVSVLGTSITYNPSGSFESLVPGQTATDTFRYTVRELSGEEGTATVTITITGVNDPPVANDDTYATDEDTVLDVPAPGLLGNDFDPEGDTLTAVAATIASSLGATVTVNANGSFTYDPTTSVLLQSLAVGESQNDTFTYEATDGIEQTNGTVTITVNGANDGPTAVDDSYSTVQDRALSVSAVDGVLANDSDPEGDIITAALDQPPGNGSVDLSSDGAFIYTPDDNFFGIDTFTYTVTDGADSSTGTVEIDVANVNDPPTPEDDLYTVEQDSTLEVSAANGVLANDTDPDQDALTAELLSGPGAGALTLNPDGSFTYIPAAGFFGRDVFIYRAIDPLGASSTASVTIDVTNNRVWRNPSNPLDVNGDGAVSPADVLVIVNYINAEGPGPVPIPTPPPPPFRDVNGDNFISAADALEVINHLNDAGQAEGEGFRSQSLVVAPHRLQSPADSRDADSRDAGGQEESGLELVDNAFAEGVIQGPVQTAAQPVRRPAQQERPLDEGLLDELARDFYSDDDELDTLFGRLA